MNLASSDTRLRNTHGVVLAVAGLFATLLTLYAAAPALAASIVPVSKDDAGAETLAEAMVAAPATLQEATFYSIPPSGTPHGTSNNLSFFPTDGDNFGIMTTGNASFADTDNTASSSGEDIGGEHTTERGDTAFDVSVLELVGHQAWFE